MDGASGQLVQAGEERDSVGESDLCLRQAGDDDLRHRRKLGVAAEHLAEGPELRGRTTVLGQRRVVVVRGDVGLVPVLGIVVGAGVEAETLPP